MTRLRHLMVAAPLCAAALAWGGGRVTTFDTGGGRGGFGPVPGRFAELDLGPARLVYLRTDRAGLRVELWPAWRPAVVLYRRGPGPAL